MVAVSVVFPAVVAIAPVPLLCLVGGLCACSVLLVLARSIHDPVKLILVGVALALLTSTLTSATILLPADATTYNLAQYFSYTAGSFVSSSWSGVRLVAPWFIAGVIGAAGSARSLNLLQLGEEMAMGRGMRVSRTRMLLLACAAMLVAPMVAVVGPISFVALVSPHIARVVLHTSNAYLVLPGAALVGAAVTLLADTAGRLAFFPHEVPAGLWTIVVIGPVAIWVTRRSVRRSAKAAV